MIIRNEAAGDRDAIATLTAPEAVSFGGSWPSGAVSYHEAFEATG